MNLSPQEEATLIARIATGDDLAVQVLESAYKKPVYGFIRARSLSDDDALEIAQETWLKFWQKVKSKSFDRSRGDCLTYLRTIAFSCRADFYRRKPQEEVLFSSLQSDTEIDIEDLLAKLSRFAIVDSAEGVNVLQEDLILRLVFDGGSPPHQLIVFGFVKRQGWEPREVVAEFSEKPLRLLQETLEDEYIATSKLAPDGVRRRFRALRESLSRLVDEVITEQKTREICKQFLHQTVGDSLLRQYFTHDPAQEISHWCQAVFRRVQKEAVKRAQPVSRAKTSRPCDVAPPTNVDQDMGYSK